MPPAHCTGSRDASRPGVGRARGEARKGAPRPSPPPCCRGWLRPCRANRPRRQNQRRGGPAGRRTEAACPRTHLQRRRRRPRLHQLDVLGPKQQEAGAVGNPLVSCHRGQQAQRCVVLSLQHSRAEGCRHRRLLHHTRGGLQRLRHVLVAQCTQGLFQHPNVLDPGEEFRGRGRARVDAKGEA